MQNYASTQNVAMREDEQSVNWVEKLRIRYTVALVMVVSLISATLSTREVQRREMLHFLEQVKQLELDGTGVNEPSNPSWDIKRYTDKRMGELQTLEYQLFGLTVFSVLASFIIIFEPIASLLNRQWKQLQITTNQLREALESSRQASAHKSRVLASMSHEIRTPMNGVMGLANELLRSDLSVEQRKYLKMLKASAGALLTLLDDILDYSKIQAGKVELEVRASRLKEVADLAAAPFWELAREKGNKLTVVVDPLLPEWVMVDAGRLRQVLTNFISNANKFTTAGTIEMHIKAVLGNDTHDSTDEQQLVRFTVQDSGPGISADKHKKIFEEFQQADGTITRKHGGTGLGLAICNSLVEMMGGTIRLDSQVGSGAKFEFDLQLERTSPPPESTVLEAVNEGQSPQKLRILVAEDGQVNQLVVRLLLENEGHDVTIVEDGIQAVREVNERSYDVVLMDVHMPEMDGLEATKRIRALPDKSRASIPVFAVTASVMREERESFLNVGMNEVIAKPIDGPQLILLLSQYCDLYARNQQAGTNA